MTVAELITILQTMPQDLPVSINDEENGIFYKDIDNVFQYDGDVEYGDRACVTLVVNETILITCTSITIKDGSST